MPERLQEDEDKVATYRASPRELEREGSLLSLVGSGDTALDIGARDGHYSRLLTARFQRVVALDLTKPDISDVECVAGDVTRLQFPDKSFEVVLCAEVLEHIPNVRAAAREIARVATKRVVIGVPYRQDLRCGRHTCQHCGHINPAWGHVNSFDEQALTALFPSLTVEKIAYVGSYTWGRTNAVASWLMDRARNPAGGYGEPCLRCGEITKPMPRNLLHKVCRVAAATDREVFSICAESELDSRLFPHLRGIRGFEHTRRLLDCT